MQQLISNHRYKIYDISRFCLLLSFLGGVTKKFWNFCRSKIQDTTAVLFSITTAAVGDGQLYL
jgi:hypothetical protein